MSPNFGPNLGILVGMKSEARLLRGVPARVAVGGGGAAGARAAAGPLAAAEGVAALLSFGLAGGLDPALPAGSLVIPRAVRAGGRDYEADAGLIARLGGATAALLLGAEAGIEGVSAKLALHRQTGAAAVDLESGAVAMAAAARGLPFAVLRAIADPATRTLPRAALVALRPDGGIALGALIGALIRRPQELPALIALGREAGAARASLLRRVREVG